MVLKRSLIGLLVVLVASFTAACSGSRMQGGIKISSIRASDPSRKEVDYAVERSRYVGLLSNPNAIARARIVEVYYRNQEFGETVPEYRLFDIQPGSVYEFLGLKNGDVIMAANGYLIPSPEHFRRYLLILQNEQEADIELRRAGQSMLLKYRFQDQPNPQAAG